MVGDKRALAPFSDNAEHFGVMNDTTASLVLGSARV
jgi:hypothetical protein